MKKLPLLPGPVRLAPPPIAVAAHGVVPPPEEVKIRLLQPCDLRCGMCWHWQDPAGREKRLPEPLLQRLFTELAGLGTQRVKLTGGEPTLRADLPALVRGAVAAGLRVTLATNAFSLTPARTAALVRAHGDAGVDTFHVSLDGADADTHDVIRGVPGAFQRTVAALSHLQEAHPRVRCKLATVVQRRNLDRLGGLTALAAALGAREVYLLLLQAEDFCADERLSLNELQRFYLGALPALLRSGSEHRVRVRVSPLFRGLLGLPPAAQAAALEAGPAERYAAELTAYARGDFGQRFYNERPCLEIVARAEIAETGDVYPCCHTELPELSMGNVHQEPFGAIWSRAGYRAFRDTTGPLPRHGRCLSCKDSHYA